MMPCLRSRLLSTGLPGLLFSAAVLLGAPPLPNTESREDKIEFALLPRAFQKNPLVNETVVTELTAEGKKLPPPSPAHPGYYVTQAAGYHAEGQGPDDRHLPTPEELAASFQRALAVNGYLPAAPAHPPTLLIVYFWGAHTDLDQGSGDENDSAFPDVKHKHLLSRAALVGGARFAEDLRQALQKQDRENEINQDTDPAIRRLTINTGPLQMFISRDNKTRQLWESCAECYYAVASAYDYAAAAQGQRRLLWRSKMTVDSQGVAMTDTLPTLILNAGKYFGVDMPEAATMAKRMQREGTVKLGPLEVEEYLHSPAAANPAGEKKP